MFLQICSYNNYARLKKMLINVLPRELTKWSYPFLAFLSLPLVASPLPSTSRHQGLPSPEAREERDPCWHPVLPPAGAERAQLQPLASSQLQPQILPQLRGWIQSSTHQSLHPRKHGTVLSITRLWKGRSTQTGLNWVTVSRTTCPFLFAWTLFVF